MGLGPRFYSDGRPTPYKDTKGLFSDLTECDFTNVTAQGTGFDRCDFKGANLSNANFKNCIFSSAHLTNTSLIDTIFENCDFESACFTDTPQARLVVSRGNNKGLDTVHWTN